MCPFSPLVLLFQICFFYFFAKCLRKSLCFTNNSTFVRWVGPVLTDAYLLYSELPLIHGRTLLETGPQSTSASVDDCRL